MSGYRLTRAELAMLGGLMALPPDPASPVGHFLASGPLPALADPATTDSLEAKGWLDRGSPSAVARPLQEAFTLASFAGFPWQVSLRRGGRQTLASFIQVGGGLVQFEERGGHLVLQEPVPADEAAGMLVPEWFVPSVTEVSPGLELTMVEYGVLLAALRLSVIREGLAGFGGVAAVPRAELVEECESFRRTMDVLASLGASVTPGREMSLAAAIQGLLAKEALVDTGAGQLVPGVAAGPLRDCVNDPDLAVLNLTACLPGRTLNAFLMWGGGRLLRGSVDVEKGVLLTPLPSRERALGVVSTLVGRVAREPVDVEGNPAVQHLVTANTEVERLPVPVAPVLPEMPAAAASVAGQGGRGEKSGAGKGCWIAAGVAAALGALLLLAAAAVLTLVMLSK